MTAGADHSHYPQSMFFVSILKGIGDISEIVCVNPAVALPLAERTDLLLGAE